MHRKIRVAVFGSSETEVGQPEYVQAFKLGESLALMGWEVVTGGYYGSMEAVSKGVQSVQGHSIGVTLQSFDPKPPNSYLSDNYHEYDIFTRMRRLIHDSDAIVVLNGGLGTLAEFNVAWLLKQVSILSNSYPIVLLGEHFEKIASVTVQSIRIKEHDLTLFSVVRTIEEVLNLIQSCESEKHLSPNVLPVTVGIAAYNAEQYIENAIESAFQQTHYPSEVIVVDDGSTDNTVKIIEKLQSKYKFLRLIRQKHAGTPKALNQIINLCQTEYLLGLDADDLLEKNSIEALYSATYNHPDAAIIYSNYVVINEDDNEVRSVQNPDADNLIERLLRLHQHISPDNKDNFLPYGHARLYRVKCLREIGGYSTDILYADDYDLVLRCAENWNFFHVPEFLYRYRWHSLNKSVVYRNLQVEDVKESVRRYKWRKEMLKNHEK